MEVVLLMVFVSVLLSLFFIMLFLCFSKKSSNTTDPQRDALLPLEDEEGTAASASHSKKAGDDSE